VILELKESVDELVPKLFLLFTVSLFKRTVLSSLSLSLSLDDTQGKQDILERNLTFLLLLEDALVKEYTDPENELKT
jgi:hypothetical protein